MKKVSIVVPVYNVEEYLEKCLDSLVNQTSNEYKVLIINDGTKDNSQNIINEYKKKHPTLIESYTKENGGLSDARNYGLKHVDTPYIIFVDSDDYVKSNLVEKCLKVIEKDKTDIVVFNYTTHHCSSDIFEDYKLEIEGIFNLEKNPELLAITPNAAWNKMYKTSLFKDNDIIYPKNIWYEDLATTPKLLLKANNISYINESLYIYQADRQDSIMSTVNEKTFDIIRVLEKIVSYFKKENVFEKYYSELKYLSIRNLTTISRIVINSNDKEFVYKFINRRDNFIKKYFEKKQTTYKEYERIDDVIYNNKLLNKIYYKYKHK